jgi:hypothetical protein
MLLFSPYQIFPAFSEAYHRFQQARSSRSTQFHSCVIHITLHSYIYYSFGWGNVKQP